MVGTVTSKKIFLPFFFERKISTVQAYFFPAIILVEIFFPVHDVTSIELFSIKFSRSFFVSYVQYNKQRTIAMAKTK